MKLHETFPHTTVKLHVEVQVKVDITSDARHVQLDPRVRAGTFKRDAGYAAYVHAVLVEDSLCGARFVTYMPDPGIFTNKMLSIRFGLTFAVHAGWFMQCLGMHVCSWSPNFH